jgi:hypothetical protein
MRSCAICEVSAWAELEELNRYPSIKSPRNMPPKTPIIASRSNDTMTSTRVNPWDVLVISGAGIKT